MYLQGGGQAEEKLNHTSGTLQGLQGGWVANREASALLQHKEGHSQVQGPKAYRSSEVGSG